MMSGLTEYVFHFDNHGEVIRIPRARWNRILGGDEVVEEYAGQTIYIAYAYILLENRKPDYCPRIDGAIYYFYKSGKIISDRRHYFDIFQEAEEDAGGVISLQYRKKKKEVREQFYWKLKPAQIQQVIDCIWK